MRTSNTSQGNGSLWVRCAFGMLGMLLITACIKEDHFGLSAFKGITAFQLAGQAGLTTIDPQARTITIPMAVGADLDARVPTVLELSNFATISPGKEEPRDFSVPVTYIVTAEDGTTAAWTVTTVPASPNPQLPNSNFDLWYTVSDYQQPGESADNTVWGTANRALAIAGDANVVPEDLGGGDLAARLTSVAAPLLVRMAAATLFTGRFTESFPSVTDPASNIDFGTPFNGRPTAFQVDYKYLPGASYEDASGNVLPGGDACDIYLLLERREGGTVERIATGWFRSTAVQPTFTTLEVPITYGPLSAAAPEFPYANIRPGESWGDPQATPTHITVVFASSAMGDSFTGAIGSELWVNNLLLIY